MNCKYMNMLRVVRGNAFKLKIAVEAYTPSGRRIDSFALGEAVLKLDKNGTLTTKDYTILEGTTILVAFDGSDSLGVYGFQMSGEYEGEAWRWANAEIFQIVETNAKASIPEGCVVLDDTYNMALKIVLSGGDGVTFTPSVSEQGIISWTNDGGLPNPEPRNIRGPRGEQGPQGEVGPKGPRGQMGLRGQIGPKGDKGDKGDTGATPVLDVTASVDENVGNPMVVVESFGPAEQRTFDFQFKNLKGQKGETGATGPQGPQGQQGEPGNYTKPASGIPLSDLNGNVASGIVYDVTANNSGATFASLSALLSSGSLSTLIPTDVRKGGMQIRFVCSSDNKYVQYRLLTTSFSTDEEDWAKEGVDVVDGLGLPVIIQGSAPSGYVWKNVATNIKSGQIAIIKKMIASTSPSVFVFYSNNNGTRTELFRYPDTNTYIFNNDVPLLEVVYYGGSSASTYSYFIWICTEYVLAYEVNENTKKIIEIEEEINQFTVDVKDSQVIDGKFVLRNGTDAATAGYVCTDFIDISGYSGSNISFNTSIVGDYAAAVITDQNKNVLWFVDGRNISDFGKTTMQQMQEFTVQIPQNGYYLRLTAYGQYYSGVSDWGIIIHSKEDYTNQIEKLNAFNEIVKSKFPYIDTRYADKKILIISDSISTDLYGNYKKWVTHLCDEGFFVQSNVTNSSYHATGFVADYTEGQYHSGTFIERITAIQNKGSYDTVILFGGINDYINQSVEWDDFTDAVDEFFEYVIKNFVQARFCVLLPLRTYNTYPNPLTNKTQQEYSEYIHSVAKSYCLPVLNLTEESGFCPFVSEFKEQWTLIPSGYSSGDGVHPNETYEREFLAPMIRQFLLGL